MKPAPFAYYAPSSVADALDAIARAGDPDDLKVLAGGQSLVPVLNLRLAQPGTLLDLNKLERDWGSIELHPAAVRVGALVRQRAAERSPVVTEWCPLLAEALPHIAHVQIRTRGTVGGSIAHADPAAELPAVALAMDAQMRIIGPRGERSVPASGFFHGFFTTALASDELLSHIDFPRLPAGTGTSFVEVSRRPGDFALVAAAAVITVRENRIADARLAFAGVASCPVRSAAAESVLHGAEPSPAVLENAAQVAAGPLTPLADLHGSAGYRRHVARVLAGKALTTALDRALTTAQEGMVS